VKKRLAGGFRAGQGVLGVHDAGRTTGFGQSIDLQHADSQLGVFQSQGHGHGSRAGHDPAQRAEVTALMPATLQHEVEHRRHHQPGGDLLAFDELPGKPGIERPHDHRSDPAIDIDRQGRQGADMEHGQCRQIAVSLPIFDGGGNGQHAPDRGAMGMHHALG